ncbi:MAG: DNA primase [Thermomicrobiales bacterium]|nr:DNA primase [Thermomicrobiales bacterium]
MARDAVAEVRERTDIVDLISAYAPLKRAGRSYKGLCPFHQEKTPSFVVFPDSQNFHCFGCGKGGDAFTFYMGVEHVEFREALTELARRAGVELSSVPTVAPEIDAHRNRLIELNELAASFYANLLLNGASGAAGREVVARRGISPEMIARFGLGFAPDAWDALLRFLSERGIDPALGREAGLLQARDGGGYYDRFRHRLLFPIRTREGRTVGFGARALGDAQPKYLNSPQSVIFDKSGLVYALDVAKDAIRSTDQVVLVEGYMDAITAHQFGYTNVVAAMGTAVTEAQIGLVKRLSRHIVLALDADSAGQMATLRSLEALPAALDSEAIPVVAASAGRGPTPQTMIAWERRLNAEIAIVRLPEGKDPDELIRLAPDRWPEVVAAAQPFLDFFIAGVTSGIDPGNARAKADAVKRVAPVLRNVGDRVVQAHYSGVLARRLQLPEATVFAEVRRGAQRTAVGASPNPWPPPSTGIPTRAAHEHHLVALLLRYRATCAAVLAAVLPDDLHDARNRELLAALQDSRIPLELDAEAIVAGLDDSVADHAERLLDSLDQTPAQYPGQTEHDARMALGRLRKERYEALLRGLQQQIGAAQEAGDAAELTDLARQLATLVARQADFQPPLSPYFRDSRDGAAAGR